MTQLSEMAPQVVADASFQRHMRYLATTASLHGWRLGEAPGPDRLVAKREEGEGRFTQLTASRVTGGRYHIEVAAGHRQPKRGVNALNIESSVTEFSDHRLLEWNGTRSFSRNELFGVLRAYIACNPARAVASERHAAQPERPRGN